MTDSRRFLLLVGLAVLSALVTLYSFTGVVMNAMFAMGPNDPHLLAARIFVVPTLLGLVATLVLLVVAWRRRPNRTARLGRDPEARR